MSFCFGPFLVDDKQQNPKAKRVWSSQRNDGACAFFLRRNKRVVFPESKQKVPFGLFTLRWYWKRRGKRGKCHQEKQSDVSIS